MTADSNLPTAAVDHVSSILTLAKQKHENAMALVGAPDADAVPRLRHVLRLLEEVELLAEDAGSYVESNIMMAALRELHQQQASIRLAIEKLEARPKPSPWALSLPWIALGLIALMIMYSFY
jgi:hypothetical protein